MTRCGGVSWGDENASASEFPALPLWPRTRAVRLWGERLMDLLNALVALIWFGPPQWDPRPGYALGILYLGLLGSVATFPLYYPLVRTVGAGKAAPAKPPP